MRLKAGLSFVQFVHARWNDVNSVHEVTDRVTGSNSIGLYAKVEGVQIANALKHIFNSMFHQVVLKPIPLD